MSEYRLSGKRRTEAKRGEVGLEAPLRATGRTHSSGPPSHNRTYQQRRTGGQTAHDTVQKEAKEGPEFHKNHKRGMQRKGVLTVQTR